MKNSFILYTEYSKHIGLLDMEKRGVLFTAIMNYEIGEPLPEMEGMVEMAFSFIKEQLDRDEKSYQDKLQKRSEAGKKGGRPKANAFDDEEIESTEKQTKAKKANAFSEKQTEANENYEKQKNPVDVDVDDDVDDKERLIDNQWKENGSVPKKINQTIEESVTKNTPLSAFLKANPSIQVDITSMSLLYGKDFELLSLKFRESRYLQEKTNSLSWVCRSYTDIVCDKYKDKTVNQTGEKGGWEEMDLPRKKVIGYHSDPKITGEEL